MVCARNPNRFDGVRLRRRSHPLAFPRRHAPFTAWIAQATITVTLFVACLCLASSAGAATVVPDTFADDNTTNGNCTLREAIQAANANAAVDGCIPGSAADTIPLAAGTYSLSLPGRHDDAAATGDLDITDRAGLTIRGAAAGTTVDGAGIDGVFEVLNDGAAIFDRLTVSSGAREDGGGIEAQTQGAKATIINSTIEGNSAGAGGGLDVFAVPGGLAATMTLVNSTVTGNRTTASGGGINVDGNAVLDVTNSTISGNSAGAAGGGIAVQAGPAVANVLSSTITANSAADEGGALAGAPGATNPTLHLKSTILAGNTATVAAPDCGGTPPSLDSQGNNLIGSTEGCTVALQGTDITGQDPMLGPLAGNGGPTQTYSLLANSPAIDKGPADAPPTDQRGVARPIDLVAIPNSADGNGSDIGAFELQASDPIRLPPTNTVQLGKLTHNRQKGTAELAVEVSPPDAGTIALFGKGLKRVSVPVPASGTVALPVLGTRKVRHALRLRGKQKVMLSVTYSPTGKSALSESREAVLMRKIKRR
jgi:CSLREA domain-containing protein